MTYLLAAVRAKPAFGEVVPSTEPVSLTFGGCVKLSAMNERVKKLSAEIRKLSPEEQAELFDELLVLTQHESDPEIEKAWAEEAERRLDAYERGETTAVPLEDVMSRLRARYPRKS